MLNSNLSDMKYAIFILVLFCSCYGKKPKIKSGLEGKPMPELELLAADSTTVYKTSSISEGKPTILFSFETWCPYCKAQTESMLSHMEKLKNITIYMVCQTQFSEFKKFYDRYHLANYSNIHPGYDLNHSMAKYFNSPGVPYLAVYSNDKKLKRVFLGKTPISAIKESTLE